MPSAPRRSALPSAPADRRFARRASSAPCRAGSPACECCARASSGARRPGARCHPPAASSIRAARGLAGFPRLPFPYWTGFRMYVAFCDFVLVRRVGLEPTCLAAPAPKAGASTNSATLAAPVDAKKRVKNNVLYLRVSVGHYENFPVASLLLPKALRPPVEIIYRFARSADDFADEGSDPDDVRLRRLSVYRPALERIARGELPAEPLFRDVARISREYGLPLGLFADLLSAFSQDVTKKR